MRIVAAKAWFENNQTFAADFPDSAALISWWRGLPDDGFLKLRFWTDRFHGAVRTGGFVGGHPWAFLLATDDPAFDGDPGPRAEIERRYPSAIVKRGKLVGLNEIDRVNAEAAATRYWGDE